jgi:hypothetical protein
MYDLVFQYVAFLQGPPPNLILYRDKIRYVVMGWDVQHTWGKEAAYRYSIGIVKGRDSFDVSDVDGKVVLQLV